MQFPNYQPVPSGGFQPPASFAVQAPPQAPAVNNIPRGNSADAAPSPKRKEVESEEVALNDNGGITRCMLYMIVEDGPLLSGNGAKKTDAMSSLRSCMVRWAVIPMLIQSIFLYYLCLQVHFENWAEEPQLTFEARCISFLAIAIYFWSMADLFFAGSIRQWFLLTQGHYSGCNRCVSILLFIWECALLMSLLVAGSLWVAMNSGTPFDAIMNALAVNYIIEIDDYITAFTSSMGGYQNAHIPSRVVLSESNIDWSQCFRVWVCLSNNLICNPIFPLLWAFACVCIVDGGVMGHNYDVYFVLILEALMIFTSDFMCGCYRCICCGCLRDDGMDTSSSEAYDLTRSKSDL